METVTLTLDETYQLSFDTLRLWGFSVEHAQSMSRIIWAGQRDECHSHGLYRLLMCGASVRTGKVMLNAVPEVFDHAPAIVRVDAKRGYSPLAFEYGKSLLLEKTRTQGIAALAINHCFHFSALWPEVEALAEEGLVSLAMLPSHSWVAPSGGSIPVFGTNPIAFGWPRPNGHPYVFDFATSAVARGEIELHRRAGKSLERGWALDKAGQPTIDPAAALDGAMLTFGGHKGSALSAMIELLAGPLIGDLVSLESKAYDDGAAASPYHGEIIIAFDPRMFTGADAGHHAERAERLFEAIVGQGARLPSQRRYQARAKSIASDSVAVPQTLLEDIRTFSK